VLRTMDTEGAASCSGNWESCAVNVGKGHSTLYAMPFTTTLQRPIRSLVGGGGDKG
jgi:hypothetical protein